MQPLERLTTLLILPLLCLPAAAQVQRSPSGDGPIRQGPTSFEIVLTAREHLIQQDLLHPNAVVVKEAPGQDPAEGQLTDTRVGLPNMSVRELSFLLPYDAAFRGLQVEVLQEVSEPIGNFEIAPLPILEEYPDPDITVSYSWVPPGVQLDDMGRDAEVYGGQMAYPPSPVEVASVGQQRAARVLRLAFHPFRWNPATRELTKIEELHLRVSWKRKAVTMASREEDLGDPCLDDTLMMLTELGLVVQEGVDDTYDFLTRPTAFDYLIISTENVLAQSVALNPFIQMKTAQGYQVAVRSVEWIESHSPAATTERSVRNYLKSIYKDVGLRHVMIISGHRPLDVGTPGDFGADPIPMFLTWPRGGNQLSSNPTDDEIEEHKNFRVPTDLYYAELSQSGNWDVDGDGFAGERRDDVRIYKNAHPRKRYVTDFHQELIVARIPFSDPDNVDFCLHPSIEYQTTSPHDLDGLIGHVRSQVWLAKAETNWWGAVFTGKGDLGDAIARDLSSKFAPHMMCQVGAWDEELLPDTFVDRWDKQAGPGLAIWSGHGNEIESALNIDPTDQMSWGDPDNDGNVIMKDDPPGFLDGLSRAFVTSGSCQNASPFNVPFTTTLLDTLMRGVAVGAILNTGNVVSNPVRQEDFGDHRWAGDVLFGNVNVLSRGHDLGICVFVTRFRGDYSGNGGTFSGAKAMNLLSTNAFGDPSIRYDVGAGWLGN